LTLPKMSQKHFVKFSDQTMKEILHRIEIKTNFKISLLKGNCGKSESKNRKTKRSKANS
jgi:hypothetical protein